MTLATDQSMGEVTLRSNELELVLAPSLGGCVKSLRTFGVDRSVDILRPMPPGQQDPFASGCFALVPYSNRLFSGDLIVAQGNENETERVKLPLNRPGVAHPVHGLGWTMPWRVFEQTTRSVRLNYRHVADEHWPFDHRCVQTISVDGTDAVFHISLENRSDRLMPAGMGFHPFFNITQDAVVTFAAPVVWQQDDEGLPQHLVNVEACISLDFRRKERASTRVLNHCYRYAGPVVLDRPSSGIRVELNTSPNLAHLVVYRPPSADWICIEPVSHATGAFSLSALNEDAQGASYLMPRQSAEAWMRVSVIKTDIQLRN